MRLLRLAAGTSLPAIELPGGQEIFVVAGEFRDEHGAYRRGSWIRYPPGAKHSPLSEAGCTLYVKANHLQRRS